MPKNCLKITFEFQDFTKTLVGQQATDFYNKLKEIFPWNPTCTLEQKSDLKEDDRLFVINHSKWCEK